MKPRETLVGFLTVLATTLIIVAACCLCITRAEAGCDPTCDNCVIDTLGGCSSGTSHDDCNTDIQEKCADCVCKNIGTAEDPECACK